MEVIKEPNRQVYTTTTCAKVVFATPAISIQ